MSDESYMTKEEMTNYLENCGLYDESDYMYYEKKMMESKKTIPVWELVEHFISTDKYFKGKPWNLRQILRNISLIIPIEDRTEEMK